MNPQLKIEGLSPEQLDQDSALLGSLSATPMTAQDPDHHTVETVFTHTTDRDEFLAIIPGSDTRAHLSSNGHPAAGLHSAESVGSARLSDPTAEADDASRIEDWVEEGGAVRA